jgi:hypothetical protein
MNSPRRIAVAAATLALGVAPAAAVANSHNHGAAGAGGTPTSGSRAEKQCRQERDAMGKTAFAQAYGTNRTRSNAFGKCVSHREHQDAAAEQAARTSAKKTCRSEQSDPSFSSTHKGETFAQFYGTGKHGHNAFGKCVASTARQREQQSGSGRGGS